MLRRTAIATLTSLALASASFAASAADQVFSNPSSIRIPETGTSGTANPYPSTINVNGVTGSVDNIRVTLSEFSHTWAGDLTFVLVSPSGQKVALIDGVGGSANFTGGDYVFTDSAAGIVSGDPIAPGNYRPSGGTRDLTAPGPAGPYGAILAAMNGSGAAINGAWSLYLDDPVGGDSGQLAGGWSLTLNVSPTTTCASEGYKGAQLTWCKNICENGLSGQVLDTWIHRWINRYRDLPYCAVEEPEIPIDET